MRSLFALSTIGALLAITACLAGPRDTPIPQKSSKGPQRLGDEFIVAARPATAKPGVGGGSGGRVAMDASGDFVVVWSREDGKPNLWESDRNIYGRRYAPDGIPAGSEFLVNEFTKYGQNSPAIAPGFKGAFVSVWESDERGGKSETPPHDIYGRPFSPAGTTNAAEFRVNSVTAGYQDSPAITMNAVGAFVVTWFSLHKNFENDTYGQLYEASGKPVGGEFHLSDFFHGDISPKRAAMAPDGSFVIVGLRIARQAETSGLYGKHFDPAGKPGKTFPISSDLGNGIGSIGVVMDGAGNFTVVWERDTIFTGRSKIIAKRFGRDAQAMGEEFTLASAYHARSSPSPDIAMNERGDFVVVWDHCDADCDWIGGEDVNTYGQYFNSNGKPWGNKFRVNSTTDGMQGGASVAMDREGNFVVVWNHVGSDRLTEVHGQHFVIRKKE